MIKSHWEGESGRCYRTPLPVELDISPARFWHDEPYVEEVFPCLEASQIHHFTGPFLHLSVALPSDFLCLAGNRLPVYLA